MKSDYGNNPRKLRNLLSEDVPGGFISQQLNNTRSIAAKTMMILSRAVREENEKTPLSSHVIPTSGAITDMLRREWGVNDEWNKLIAPRFMRLNAMTNSEKYGTEVNGHFLPSVPADISKDFSKKRIDHRHHAMDAIVIACTTRKHINYINRKSAQDTAEDTKIRKELMEKKGKESVFRKPWENFTQDVHDALSDIHVSFKKNNRSMRHVRNIYTRYVNVDGVMKKEKVRQTKGLMLAPRMSLHNSTYYGLARVRSKKEETISKAISHIENIVDKDIRRELLKVKKQYGRLYTEERMQSYLKGQKYKICGKDVSKVEVFNGYEEFCVSRKSPGEMNFSDKKKDEDKNKKKLSKIKDEELRKIISSHYYKYNSADAFLPQGLRDMNEHIADLNGGKRHKPIKKIRYGEMLGEKVPLGKKGCKDAQYIESASGTNQFAVYENADGKRIFYTVPYREAVKRREAGENTIAPLEKDGAKLMFILSPGDTVSVEMYGEKKYYRFVSSSNKQAYFVPASFAVAVPVEKGGEYESDNKIQSDKYYIDSNEEYHEDKKAPNIKDICHKVDIDRLGNIIREI